VLEKLLEEISFDATERGGPGAAITIDAAYVDGRLASLARDQDLSRFIL
jgi:ATP-dependent HslUV protease ATP-binding subunit HslU